MTMRPFTASTLLRSLSSFASASFAAASLASAAVSVSRILVGIGGVLLFSACASTTDETVGGAHQAWTAPADAALNERVLGFEEPSDWEVSGTVGQSTVRTEGSYSLAVASSGWVTVNSQPAVGLGTVGDTVTYDVFLTQPASWGETRLVVRSPSQQLWWHEVGSRSLVGLAAGEWHSVQFTIDEALAAKLEAATDLKIQVVLNGPDGTKYLDRLDFDQPADPNGSGGSSGAGGSGNGGTGGTGTGGGAQHATNDEILGFESVTVPGRGAFVASCSDCSSSATVTGASGASDHTEGEGAITVAIPGVDGERYSTTLTTPNLTKLELVTDTLGFDLRIPPQSSGSSFGAVQVFVDAPQAGLYNQWIGQKELDGSMLYQGLFRRVQFPLPVFVRNQLATANYSDLKFRFVLNEVPAGSYTFDWLALREQIPDVVPPAPSKDIDDVLGMETLAGWSVTGAQGVTLGDEVTQGNYAICAETFTHLELKSVNLSSIGVTNGKLSFDVKLPEPVTETETVGLNVFLTIPSQNLHRQTYPGWWVGLTGNPAAEPETFQSVEVALPPAVRTLLETAQYGDLSVEISVSMPRSLAGEPLCFDDVDFGHRKFADVGRPPTLTRKLDVDLPVGVSPLDVAVYKGQASRRYGSGLGILAESSVDGDVVSTGWFSLGRGGLGGHDRAGTNASVRNVYVKQNSQLRDGATIEESIWTTVAEGPTSGVEGAVVLGTKFQEIENYRWNVEAPLVPADAPSASGSGVLAPGAYASLHLKKGETRTLRPGTYVFRKILLEGGTLHLDNDFTGDPQADAIRLLVDGTVVSAATVEAADPSHNNVWWVQLGLRNLERFELLWGPSPPLRSFRISKNFFGSIWAEYFILEGPSSGTRPTVRGAVFTRGTVSIIDGRVVHVPPLEMEEPTQPSCAFTLGSADLDHLDSDRDGLSTCEETSDASGWTDPSVFNGLETTVADAEHAEPDADHLDTVSEVEALLASATLDGGEPLVRNQYLGWDSASGSTTICEDETGPGWAECDGGPKLVAERGFLYAEMRGQHCFRLEAGGMSHSNGAAGAIFVDGEFILAHEHTDDGPVSARACVSLSAGAHEIRVVREVQPLAFVGLRYCFGGDGPCVEGDSEPLLSRALRANYSPTDVVACDTDPTTCTETCPCTGVSPCSDGNACTVDICNFPAPGLHRYLAAIVDDGNACTLDACDPETGVSHLPPSDDDECTIDRCDPVLGSVHERPDDGKICTEFVCDSPETGGTHVLHPEFAISDGDPCTLDLCDAEEDVVHEAGVLAAGPCVDVAQSSCSSATGFTIRYLPAGTPCGTGRACTADGACSYPGEGAPSTPAGQPTTAVEEIMDQTRGAALPGCALDAPPAETLMRVSGTVFDESATSELIPLPGARVSVLGRCEYGYVETRADGSFDFSLPGGGIHTLHFEKNVAPSEVPFLPADRRAAGYWGDFVSVQRVVLLRRGPVLGGEPIDVSAGPRLLSGESIVDRDGTHQGTPSLFLGQGTTFTVRHRDGSTAELEGPKVLRITPFTSGPNGVNRMPAELPGETEYTHAFDVSFDGVDDADVVMSRPAVYYIDNFRASLPGSVSPPALDVGADGLGVTLMRSDTGNGSPDDYLVGNRVPSFYYNERAGVWERIPDGRIVGIECSAGAVTGLTGVESADLEVGEVGSLEAAVQSGARSCGDQLWRVELDHFSLIDLNYRGNPVGVASFLPDNRPPDGVLGMSECGKGSVIDIEARTLREDVALPGIEHALHFNSDAMFGDARGRRMEPIGFSFSAAVRVIEQGNSYGTPGGIVNERWLGRTTWDGTISGSPVLGSFRAYTLGWIEFMARTSQFGPAQGFFDTKSVLVRTQDARTRGLGGWTLSGHHSYDVTGGIVFRGDTGAEEAAKPRRIESIRSMSEFYMALEGVDDYADRTFTILRDGSVVVRGSFDPPGATGRTRSLYLVRPDGSVRPITPFWELAGFLVEPNTEEILVADKAAGRNRILRYPSPGAWEEDTLPSPTVVRDFGSLSNPADIDELVGMARSPDGSIVVALGHGFEQTTTVHRLSGDVLSEPLFRLDGHSLAVGNETLRMAIREEGGGAAIYGSFSGKIFRWSALEGLKRLVGGGTVVTPTAGTPALNAIFPRINELGFSEDGKLIFSAWLRQPIWQLEANGELGLFAGRDTLGANLLPSGDGGPVEFALLGDQGTTFARAPSGEFWVMSPVRFNTSGTTYFNLRRITGREPVDASGSVEVADRTGTEIFSFYEDGRHRLTRDARTGVVLREFFYDPATKLLTGFSERGRTTEVIRTGDSVRLRGPFGHETVLSLDAQGYASTIARPDAGVVRLVHDPSGLLRQMVDEMGETHTYEYDELGGLISDESPGDEESLQTLTGKRDIVHTNGEGEEGHFEFARAAEGGSRSVERADGSGYTLEASADGGSTKTNSDGSVETELWGEHPALPGVRLPVSRLVQLPDGQLVSSSHAATVAANGDWVDTIVTNGLASSARTSRVPGSRETTSSSAMGRTVHTTLDDSGRPVEIQVGDLMPLRMTYDGQGRLAEMERRLLDGTWDSISELDYFDGSAGVSAGYLESSSTEDGTTTFTRDAFGRASSISVAETTVAFGFDPAGRLEEVRNGRGALQSLEYTPVDLLKAYVPSGGGRTEWSWDRARRLDEVSFPSNGSGEEKIVFVRDDGDRDFPGRLRETREFHDGAVLSTALSYGDELLNEEGDPVGRPAQVAELDREGHKTRFDWNGPILVGEDYEPASGVGLVVAGYSWTPNNSLLPASDEVRADGAVVSDAAYEYNADGQLESISSSGEAIDYRYDGAYAGDVENGHHGLLEELAVGKIREKFAYDEYGRLASSEVVVEDPAQSGSEVLLTLVYERSRSGRVTRRVLTRGAAVRDTTYTYSAAGELETVTENGETTWYQYDAAGNRIDRRSSAPPCNPSQSPSTCAARYDADDRLMGVGGNVYTYDGRGTLSSWAAPGGSRSAEYDLQGAMDSIGFASGPTVDYVNDALHRRVAKKRNGSVKAQFVRSGDLRIEAELEEDGDLRCRFLYGKHINVPDVMSCPRSTGPALYRIVTDQLGSPLLVVNVEDPEDILLEASYDEWGNVTEYEVNGLGDQPWPIPFGFAGGLYDEDTGLVRFGARDYDPSIGRWTSKDPILFEGGQTNLYVYVGNDPINAIDITGLIQGVPDWLTDLSDSGASQVAGDFTSGLTAGLTFGVSNLIIDAAGLGDQQNKCSSAYAAGQYTSYAAAGARLSYAALAKGGSLAAAGNLGRAVAWRNGLKLAFRGPVALFSAGRTRLYTAGQVLSRYGSVEAGIAAAGRTNPWLNAWAAGILVNARHGGSL